MSARLAAAGLLAGGALAAATALRASPAEDYVLYCMGCHGPEARGVPGKVPPLAGALALYMRSPEGRNYVLRVPGAANSVLNDAQLAGVLNWLVARYPAAQATAPADFSVAEVTQARHSPLANVQATRREVLKQLAASGPAPAGEY
jgi:mono/diheme cytochrome c family protein